MPLTFQVATFIARIVNNRRRTDPTGAAAGPIDAGDRDNYFELNSKPGETVSVALSPYVRDSDRDRFSALHSGDQVRVEGKFINHDRFEMLSFLNNEY